MNRNEFKTRVSKLQNYMSQEGIDLSIIIDPHNQYYFTGFYAITYSRPIITLISDEATEIIVPNLEKEHAMIEAYVDTIHSYYEHPEKAHIAKSPYKLLFDILTKVKHNTIGIEKNVFSVALEEQIKQKTSAQLMNIGEKITQMRLIKSSMEIENIKKAAELVDKGVSESINGATEGMTELEIDAIGTTAILKFASEKFPNVRVEYFSMSPSGSERTAIPHIFSSTRKIKKGDVIIHSRQVAFKGYRSENERTFFCGKPSGEIQNIFDTASEAQKAAIREIRAGVSCKEIDEAARAVIREAGYADYFFHRTGHGLGLSVHEPPYLRFDEGMILKEGMVVSVEPGIYIPAVGGSRHSDTVIVRRNYGEVITKTPTTLDYLTRCQ